MPSSISLSPSTRRRSPLSSASLEEREREETFRLKWLKTKLTKPTLKIRHYELGQLEYSP
jgi:hypothetical protein